MPQISNAGKVALRLLHTAEQEDRSVIRGLHTSKNGTTARPDTWQIATGVQTALERKGLCQWLPNIEQIALTDTGRKLAAELED